MGQHPVWALESVPIEEGAIREWLRGKIDHWRGLRDDTGASMEMMLTATLYIDAYQNVYCTLFGGPYGKRL